MDWKILHAVGNSSGRKLEEMLKFYRLKQNVTIIK